MCHVPHDMCPRSKVLAMVREMAALAAKKGKGKGNKKQAGQNQAPSSPQPKLTRQLRVHSRAFT